MVKLRLTILIVFVFIAVGSTNGFDFWGLFGSGTTTTTTTPAPTSSTPLSTTLRAIVTTTTQASGRCWWTECGKRCVAGSLVYDMDNQACTDKKIKFKCCSQ